MPAAPEDGEESKCSAHAEGKAAKELGLSASVLPSEEAAIRGGISWCAEEQKGNEGVSSLRNPTPAEVCLALNAHFLTSFMCR